ncbi:MAG: UPF0175 family protein [Candidatus Saliniplasma sp.]
MSKISVKVPNDISEILDLKGEKEIQSEGKLLIALELYREGRISAGKAAELAGISFDEFLDELEKRKMKLYTLLDIDEIKKEIDGAEKYVR